MTTKRFLCIGAALTVPQAMTVIPSWFIIRWGLIKAASIIGPYF